MPWDQATRVEARDFSLWIQVAGKPAPPRAGCGRQPARPGSWYAEPGDGQAGAGPRVCDRDGAHGERVLRGFYEFHCEAGTGPMVNPFPLARPAGGGRMPTTTRWSRGNERRGFTGRGCHARPRRIPDEKFNELFALLRFAPGPCPGRVLGLHRGAGVGTAGRAVLAAPIRASS